MKAILVGVVVMAATLLPPICRSAESSPAAHAATAPTPIHTRGELERYLKTTPLEQSPLSLLPMGARKRFLDTLVWGRKGIGGFDPADLQQYLTDAQIEQVLTLLDLQSYATDIHGRVTPLTAAERNAPETALERKFDKLYFADHGAAHDVGQSASIPAQYDRLLASYQKLSTLAQLDDSDVGLLFRAATIAAFSSHGLHYLDDLRLDLADLHRRGVATPSQVVKVHDQLAAARHFDDANKLAKQYPAAGIAPLPPLHRAPNIHDGDPTVLVMEPDGRSMLRKSIDMHVPLRIVVVGTCHIAIDALRAIRADPQLDKLFHEHGMWMAGQGEPLTDVLDWNRRYGNQPMHVAWHDSEWPRLNFRYSPTFYVFRSGKLVDHWAGWGSTGMHDLRTHLRKDGLLH